MALIFIKSVKYKKEYLEIDKFNVKIVLIKKTNADKRRIQNFFSNQRETVQDSHNRIERRTASGNLGRSDLSGTKKKSHNRGILNPIHILALPVHGPPRSAGQRDNGI
jgi:hypothetical protein